MKDTNMLIEIPNGFLLIEKKGAVDEYPGIFVSYSKDGKTADEIIAAIEYDTIDNIIKTITYETYSDEPTHIIKHPIETTNDELTFVDTRKNAILGIGDDYGFDEYDLGGTT